MHILEKVIKKHIKKKISKVNSQIIKQKIRQKLDISNCRTKANFLNSCTKNYRDYANNIARKEILKLFLLLFKSLIFIVEKIEHLNT